jgi:GNAT superfamily N-acetyltransferase
MLDYEKLTSKYYAQWLGKDQIISNHKINLLFNPERDNIPKGFSNRMDIFIIIKNGTVNIAYGNRVKPVIQRIKDGLCETNVEHIKSILETNFSLIVEHSIKYVYKNEMAVESNAIALTEKHLELFLNFFQKNNPNCEDYSWVDEYFLGLVKKKYCHGVIVGDILVSANDAPDMPFMSDCIQEIGITTLEEYRGKGYARMVCISMIKELLQKNICPMWSTGIGNIVSDKLAHSIGFEKYADVLAINKP